MGIALLRRAHKLGIGHTLQGQILLGFSRRFPAERAGPPPSCCPLVEDALDPANNFMPARVLLSELGRDAPESDFFAALACNML